MAKQTEIPGTERVKNKAIAEAADTYRKARDRRVRATRPEVEAKQSLIDLMHKHGLAVYNDGEIIVEIIPTKEKVKVRDAEEEEPDDE